LALLTVTPLQKRRFLKLFELEIGDGKYSKIPNICTRFELNTEYLIQNLEYLHSTKLSILKEEHGLRVSHI